MVTRTSSSESSSATPDVGPKVGYPTVSDQASNANIGVNRLRALMPDCTVYDGRFTSALGAADGFLNFAAKLEFFRGRKRTGVEMATKRDRLAQ